MPKIPSGLVRAAESGLGKFGAEGSPLRGRFLKVAQQLNAEVAARAPKPTTFKFPFGGAVKPIPSRTPAGPGRKWLFDDLTKQGAGGRWLPKNTPLPTRVRGRALRRVGMAGLVAGVGYGGYRYGKSVGISSGTNGLTPNSSGGMGAANIRNGINYGSYGY